MREILFRGKRLDNGEWVHGFYIKQEKTTYCFAEDYEKNSDNTIHYIAFDRMTDWGLPNKHLIVQVDLETVGQYTGLTDKNGRKIFEGDIIKDVDTGKVFSIEWHEPAFIRVDNRRYFFWDMCAESYEVIGNIYDNPELLKD